MNFAQILIFTLVLVFSLMLTGTHGQVPQFQPPTNPEDFAGKMAEMGSQFQPPGR